MTNNTSVSWNKIITICSVFGIPLVSVGFMLCVWLTRLDDKMTNFSLKQQEQGFDIKGIREDLNVLKVRVDTITQRQKDNQRETEYRFQLHDRDNKR